MKRTHLLFIILLFLASCYTSEEINKAMSGTFLGQHYSELITLGIPTQVIDDGKGGRLLHYVWKSTYTTSGYSTSNTNVNSTTTEHGTATIYDNYIWGSSTSSTTGNVSTTTTYTPPQTYTKTYWIVFHIDGKGLIKELQWRLPVTTLQKFAKEYYKLNKPEVDQKSKFSPPNPFMPFPKKNNAKKTAKKRTKENKNLSGKQYFERGLDKYQSNDFEGAISDFSQTIKDDPESAIAYYNRGLAKMYIKDMNGACNDWNKAIELGLMANDLIEKYCD